METNLGVHSSNIDENERRKKKKYIFGFHVVMAAIVGVWWHEKYMVKEPSQDLKMAREFYLRRLYYGSESACIEQLRLSKQIFDNLCKILRVKGGLRDTMHVCVEEAVAMFLYILAHNLKNRVIKFQFMRSGETVSRYFHAVLRVVIKLGKHYLVQLTNEDEGFEEEKWVWFQDCLGALDGTYVPITVPLEEQGRYRNRKNFIATNVLGACSRDLKFVYVLPGWEGSAADGKVLRNALGRLDPLVVPIGKYYLVDAGYANTPGFLAPYRGTRYHLNEWSTSGNNPRTYKELFNLRHSIARNVIERAFGLLKKRWAILRTASFFDVNTQVNIISACAILHNFIRVDKPNDPLLVEVEAELANEQMNDMEVDEEEEIDDDVVHGGAIPIATTDHIRTVRTTNEWTQRRDALAQAMFVEYQQRRGNL